MKYAIEINNILEGAKLFDIIDIDLGRIKGFIGDRYSSDKEIWIDFLKLRINHYNHFNSVIVCFYEGLIFEKYIYGGHIFHNVLGDNYIELNCNDYIKLFFEANKMGLL